MENLDNLYFYLDSKESAFKSDTPASFSINYDKKHFDFNTFKYEAALIAFGYLPKTLTKNQMVYFCSNICSDKYHNYSQKNVNILRCYLLKKNVAKNPGYKFVEFEDRIYVNLNAGKYNVIKMMCKLKQGDQFVDINKDFFHESFFIIHARKISPFK